MHLTARATLYVLAGLFCAAAPSERIIVSSGCLGPCLRLARVGPETNCSYSCRFYNHANADLLRRADGVVGFPGGVSRKHPGQTLFAYWQESSANTPGTQNARIMRHFNYSFSYRQDSVLRRDSGGISEMLYEMFARFQAGEMPEPIPYETKLRAPLASTMISSGGNTRNLRGRVIEGLEAQGIAIAHYGSYRRNARFSPSPLYDRFDVFRDWRLQRAHSPAALVKVKAIAGHLFHLAFENSDCPWYHTEKAFQPLVAGTIPVYLGAATVHKVMPPGSFVHVKDYNSPKELAEQLTQIASNRTRYESYFAWRETAAHQGLPDSLYEFATRHTTPHLAETQCTMCRLVSQPPIPGPGLPAERCERRAFSAGAGAW